MSFPQIASRVLQAVAAMLAMSIAVFLSVYAIGDPIEILISPEATVSEREAMIGSLGLNLPLWQQYWRFLTNAMQGDWGQSFVLNQPVLQVILDRLPATLELAISATVLAITIGVPLGLYAGIKQNAITSRVIMIGSIIGFSTPTFWLGLLLITFFSVYLGWLPSTGRGQTVELAGAQWSILTLDGLKHITLPALNLSLFKISLIIRLTNAGVQEIMLSDYIQFARARGLSNSRIIFVHVLKNISIPIVTVIAMEFGSTIAFAVVTESIFAWPGMGKLIIDSINMLDRPMIVAYLMITVLIFITVNLLSDLAYGFLDPRIRVANR
jgi:peptide/nickel transport system permease protein